MYNSPDSPLSLMLVCGEASGDQLGSELMAALQEVGGNTIRITGMGGPAMVEQGLNSIFPLDVTAVMGLREVIPAIPEILRRVSVISEYAVNARPDAVVLIDSPDFTHRIAKQIKKRDAGIGTINYVAPQVWASRAYRARKMARFFDLVLALFPFETSFFEAYGLKSVFVGHPVIQRAKLMKNGPAFRARHNIPVDAPLLVVLPGSRTNEIRFILPAFRDAVSLLAKEIPGLVTVLPIVAHVEARVREEARNWPVPLHLVTTTTEKFESFDAANLALAASGTVTTELALARRANAG